MKPISYLLLTTFILFTGCSDTGKDNLRNEIETIEENCCDPKAEDYGPFPT